MKFTYVNFLLFFELFGIAACFSQGSADTVIYYDKVWATVSSKDSAQYYRVIKDYHLSRSAYEVKDYFFSGEIQMTGQISDLVKETKTGQFTWYYKNGNKSKLATYSEGKQTGKLFEWYEDGKPSEEGYYVIQGDYNFYKMSNSWDSTGFQMVKDGAGEFKKYFGRILVERGNYLNGEEDGEWEHYYNNGKPWYFDKYKKGVFISGVSYDSLGKKYKYKKHSLMPEAKGGIKAFYSFLAKNINYPEEAREKDISGRVQVRFYVDEKGNTGGFQIVKSVHPLLDAEAIRAIKTFRRWSPAENLGMKVKAWLLIPINFSLK
jgi:TonB family protein